MSPSSHEPRREPDGYPPDTASREAVEPRGGDDGRAAQKRAEREVRTELAGRPDGDVAADDPESAYATGLSQGAAQPGTPTDVDSGDTTDASAG